MYLHHRVLIRHVYYNVNFTWKKFDSFVAAYKPTSGSSVCFGSEGNSPLKVMCCTTNSLRYCNRYESSLVNHTVQDRGSLQLDTPSGVATTFISFELATLGKYEIFTLIRDIDF